MSSLEKIPKGDKKESEKELVYSVKKINISKKEKESGEWEIYNVKELNSFKKEQIYNFFQIEHIEKPMLDLVGALKADIDNETYDVLIGDDASGRIPTRILWDVAKERMRIKHPDWSPEKQREALKVYFIAGGKSYPNDKELSEFFRKISPKIKKKALFVTEFIQTGDSALRIGKLMNEANVQPDLAAVVALKGAFDSYKNFKYFGKIFKSEAEYLPGTYGRPELSGVKKDESSKKLKAHAVPRALVGGARDDVNMMTDKILKEVWKR